MIKWGLLLAALLMLVVIRCLKRAQKNNITDRKDKVYQVSPRSLPAKLKTIRGHLPETLVEEVRAAGPEVLPQFTKAWAELDVAVQEELVVLWEKEGYMDYWIKALGAKGEIERLTATVVLSRIKNKRIIKPLITALGEPDRYVPARVAEVLVAFGSEAVEPLVKSLAELPEQTRCMVIAVLEELADNRAVPALAKELLHSSVEVRQSAATALGEIGGPEVLDNLIPLLKDSDCKVKSRVAKALGKLGSHRAVPALEEALNDEAWLVRTNAREALETINRTTGGKDV